MIKPVFLKGRELERVLTAGVDAGDTMLPVSAGLDFSVGDHVLVSDADGSAAEYVGQASATAANSVTTALGVASVRSAGALVWRAAAVMAWRSVTASPQSVDYDQGVRTEWTVGGDVVSSRLGSETVEERLRFSEISLGEFEDFRTWLQSAAQGGLLSFTRVGEERGVAVARLVDTRLERREKRRETLGLELRLAIIESGGVV